MADKILGNNQVNIYGEVVSEFTFSHEVYGEGFYLLKLSVKRLSKVYDTIPLMISERLADVTKDLRGCFMEATGTRKTTIGWYYLCLFGIYILTRRNRKTKNRIISFWTVISASRRCTARRRLDVRSPTFLWR